jgi:hypothetical protein
VLRGARATRGVRAGAGRIHRLGFLVPAHRDSDGTKSTRTKGIVGTRWNAASRFAERSSSLIVRIAKENWDMRLHSSLRPGADAEDLRSNGGHAPAVDPSRRLTQKRLGLFSRTLLPPAPGDITCSSRLSKRNSQLFHHVDTGGVLRKPQHIYGARVHLQIMITDA